MFRPRSPRPRLALGAAVTAALPLVLSAAPASAAGSCTVSVPAKVAVSSAVKTVPVTFGADCADDGFASWSAVQATAGEQTYVEYPAQASFPVYDFDTRGVWTWTPQGAYDSKTLSATTQNTPTTDVRLATSAYLVLTKSGTTMSVYARTSRYSPYYGKWIGFIPPSPAYLQWRSSTGSWTNLRQLAPSSSGEYRTSFTVSKAMYYRLVIADNQAGGIWGTASPQQYK